MMRKVTVEDAGDTKFLEGDTEDRYDFNTENDYIFDKKVITEAGDSGKLRLVNCYTAWCAWRKLSSEKVW